MKIVAISDLHGQLPDIPTCDLLLIAGDVCPVWDHKLFYQDVWLRSVFGPWLKAQPADQIIGVWGNHDWIGEKLPPDLDGWTVLTDELTEASGLRVYGLPWQKRFNDWAFNLDEPELNLKYEAIPPCDIIVSHGPPYGYGDRTPRERAGSQTFLKRIDEIEPKLVVFGHIHCDPGVWTRGKTTLANVTLLNDAYQVVNQPKVFDF